MFLHQIHLEARLPEQNVFRFFHILFGNNLFGDLQITVTNGRIGNKGRRKHFFFKEEQTYLEKLRQLLRKRLNAQSRIGCNYVIKEATVEGIFIEELTKPKRRAASALTLAA